MPGVSSKPINAVEIMCPESGHLLQLIKDEFLPLLVLAAHFKYCVCSPREIECHHLIPGRCAPSASYRGEELTCYVWRNLFQQLCNMMEGGGQLLDITEETDEERTTRYRLHYRHCSPIFGLHCCHSRRNCYLPFPENNESIDSYLGRAYATECANGLFPTAATRPLRVESRFDPLTPIVPCRRPVEDAPLLAALLSTVPCAAAEIVAPAQNVQDDELMPSEPSEMSVGTASPESADEPPAKRPRKGKNTYFLFCMLIWLLQYQIHIRLSIYYMQKCPYNI